MSTITTKDDTQIYYKDRRGQGNRKVDCWWS